MKLYIKKYLLICIVSIGLISCAEDFLDRPSLNGISDANFFTNEQEANQMLNAVYGVLQQRQFAKRIPYLDAASDNALTLTGNAYSELELGEQTSLSEVIVEKWADAYDGISKANTFLDGVNAAVSNVTILNTMTAEARFLRAFYYYHLVYFYGDVPLILTTPSVDEYKNLVRTPKADVLQAISDDLTFAIANLSNTASDFGRVTKGAVAALQMRIALYEKDYARVTALGTDFMAGTYGNYELQSDLTTMFLETSEGNSEVIWDIQYSSKDGSGEAAEWDKEFNYHLGILAATADFLSAFESGDLRKGAFLHVDGVGYGSYPGVWPDYDNDGIPTAVTSMHQNPMKKFVNPDNESPGPYENSLNASGQNFQVFRYADILLMYAEAKIETNVAADALVPINLVRARAGLADVVSTDQTVLRTLLRNERRVELCFEGTRYLDLVRWGELEATKIAQGYAFISDLWPIPQNDRILAPGLTQNPGY